MSERPVLYGAHRRPGVRGAVLVLHGGAEEGLERPQPWGHAALRMWPFTWDLRSRGLARGVVAGQLRYRHRGWNDPHAHPLDDARWALDRLRRRHGGVPVVLLGHSMGARAALRLAGEPGVVGVVALAPWVPRDEPVEQLAGRTLVLLHGDADDRTRPTGTRRYAARAADVTDRVAHLEVAGSGHALLERWRDWQRLTVGSALAMLGAARYPAPVGELLAQPADERATRIV